MCLPESLRKDHLLNLHPFKPNNSCSFFVSHSYFWKSVTKIGWTWLVLGILSGFTWEPHYDKLEVKWWIDIKELPVELPFLSGSSLLCLHVSGDLWPKSTLGAQALYHLWPLLWCEREAIALGSRSFQTMVFVQFALTLLWFFKWCWFVCATFTMSFFNSFEGLWFKHCLKLWNLKCLSLGICSPPLQELLRWRWESSLTMLISCN